MSRVGNAPIKIPEGITVIVDGSLVEVKGSGGDLSINLRPEIRVLVEKGEVIVKREKEERMAKSLHGLTRSLIANMITGVRTGWQKKLELKGVGFRAAVSGDKLVLNVGYSHPVEVLAPPGITFLVEANTKITVSGIDKGLVGQMAANIRQVRVPDAYKGKGIRYLGEVVKTKPGKAGKVGVK